MRNQLLHFKLFLGRLMTDQRDDVYVEENAAPYLSYQETVLLSRTEEDLIDLETHRMLLILRAKELKRIQAGSPAPGNTSYAVFGPF